jgi:hypothetical protein
MYINIQGSGNGERELLKLNSESKIFRIFLDDGDYLQVNAFGIGPSSNNAVTYNTWKHIAVVCQPSKSDPEGDIDRITVSLFIDGSYEAEVKFDPEITSYTSPLLTIGASADTIMEEIVVVLADFDFESIEDQILRLYDRETYIYDGDQDVLFYYTFGAQRGLVMEDRSVHEQHGLIVYEDSWTVPDVDMCMNRDIIKAGEANQDPQFTGFAGQSFQVHGIPGAVFNLISTPSKQ